MQYMSVVHAQNPHALVLQPLGCDHTLRQFLLCAAEPHLPGTAAGLHRQRAEHINCYIQPRNCEQCVSACSLAENMGCTPLDRLENLELAVKRLKTHEQLP